MFQDPRLSQARLRVQSNIEAQRFGWRFDITKQEASDGRLRRRESSMPQRHSLIIHLPHLNARKPKAIFCFCCQNIFQMKSKKIFHKRLSEWLGGGDKADTLHHFRLIDCAAGAKTQTNWSKRRDGHRLTQISQYNEHHVTRIRRLLAGWPTETQAAWLPEPSKNLTSHLTF